MNHLAVPLLALLTGCAPTQPSGPGAAELQSLIAEARSGVTPNVRDVSCKSIAEEGSEWRCRYRERVSDGRWVALETFVAAHGSGWVLIDGVADPDRPPSS